MPRTWSSEVPENEAIIEPPVEGAPERALCMPLRLRLMLLRLLARPCTEAMEESLAAESARVCEATPERREWRPLSLPGCAEGSGGRARGGGDAAAVSSSEENQVGLEG